MRKFMEEDYEDEIQNFIKVWFYTILSLTYCYFIVSKFIPKGFLRLVSVLPVLYLFTVLPLSLTSLNLGATTSFYLTWLGNFKLLLFSFNLGPLSVAPSAHYPKDKKPACSSPSSTDPSKSLLLFISLACLPIKLKPNTTTLLKSSKEHQYVVLGLRVLVFSAMTRIYDYREYLNPNVILLIYCVHVYLLAEIHLAIGGFLAQTILGQDLVPPFDEPYRSNSLQEFWGRRWNLMAASVLRSAVYDPVHCVCAPVLGKTWAPLPCVFLTFVVSGLMHEILYYYITRAHPTWEVTWFFVLHGVCTGLEAVIKRSLNNRWQLNPWVSRVMTLGFVNVTGCWLFFPQLIRNGVDVKAIGEYGILVEFVKNKIL